MNLDTCLATDAQRMPDLMRAESEAAALAALGAILACRESEVLTKALQEARVEGADVLKAAQEEVTKAAAALTTASEAVRKTRAALDLLPDEAEALEAGRSAENRVEREAARARLVDAERARQEVRANLEQVVRPRVRKASDRLADIDARLAALADPPQPDQTALAVLAEALIGGPRDSD